MFDIHGRCNFSKESIGVLKTKIRALPVAEIFHQRQRPLRYALGAYLSSAAHQRVKLGRGQYSAYQHKRVEGGAATFGVLQNMLFGAPCGFQNFVFLNGRVWWCFLIFDF